MKYNTLNSIKTIFLIVAFVGLTQSANAGYTNKQGVYIGSNYVTATMYGTRYSADTVQYMYCKVTGNDDPNDAPYMECWARDKNYKLFACYSTDNSVDKFLKILQTVTDSSYVFLRKNQNGSCLTMQVKNGSLNL